MKLRSIIIVLLVSFSATSWAQDFSQYEEKEEEAPKLARIKCDTVPTLADSIFNAIKTKKFVEVEKYTPSLEDLMATYDTLEIEGTFKLVRIKHNYMVVNLKKQHAVMLKTAKAYKFSLRSMEEVNRSIRYNETSDGHRYAEVLYLVKRGKKQYLLSFLAIKLVDHWYIGDHLKLQRM